MSYENWKYIRLTYHLEEETGWEDSVDWHCNEVRELPWAINEHIDIFGQHID